MWIWLAGLTGLFGFTLPYNALAQDSSVNQFKNSDVTAIYFESVKNDNAPWIDFAELERQHPLTLDQRLHLTPEVVQHLSQEQLDQLYARLTAGPMPDGPFEGTAFLSPLHREHLRLIRQVLGTIVSSPTKYSQRLQNHWMELWQGKVFDRRHSMLHNRVNWELVHDIAPLLGHRFAQVLHQLPKDTLLFPAKMYCGQSKLDSRRESIILDYAYTYNDDLPQNCEEPQYCEMINKLVGREGLNIRDEIRMVHPGLYLGRVYLGKFFLLNFMVMNAERTRDWKQQVLEKEQSSTIQDTYQEDCWTGTPYNK